ncbi:pro-neuregulin-1, membrane-bound isoform [Aplochiton taeniatus]
MTEGVDEEASAGPVVVALPRGAASPARSPEGENPKGGHGAGGDDDDATDAGERGGGGGAAPLGLLGLAGASCCVCVQVEQVRGCLRSEKICILPILACLLSLALCTAGLKWVFVDKIFEYDPPKHMGMGQDPFVILADPTMGLPLTSSRASATLSIGLSTTATNTIGQPEVVVEGKPSRVTPSAPTSALTHRTDTSKPTTTTRKWTPTAYPRSSTPESNDIVIPTYSAATSTTPAVKTSSHVTPCSDAKKNYCVNGGECFTLEVTPGTPKFLCRCPNEFTGDRCQNYVMASFYKHLGIEFMEAEELYQKRVLTITGICIALLVVGIMCVVAYCKTKKQRKKFQDRLRQSLRSERNHMANSADNAAWPCAPSPPLSNVQLVNQYLSKNAMPALHVMEKESETSFSTSQYTSSAQQSTAVTHTSSQSWTNGRSESVLLDTRSVLVKSSGEGASRHATASRRGRLNGTAGANGDRGSASFPHICRDTPTDSCRDSPYSERYVSAMTTPTRLSPVQLAQPLTPVTPGSPPSEASAPLSSLATSVTVTPAGDEERPLLFATPPRPRDRSSRRQHDQQKRNSAHYNHGLEAPSPPPSPLMVVEDEDYQITQEYEIRQDVQGPAPAGGLTAPAAAPPLATSPHGLPQKLKGNANNHSGREAKRTKAGNGRPRADGHKAAEGDGASGSNPERSNPERSSSERSSSERSNPERSNPERSNPERSNPERSNPERSSSDSETEEEQAGEDTPFLSLQNPMVLGLALSLETASSSGSSCRTNPALLLSPQDELQARLSSAIANQDPIAV